MEGLKPVKGSYVYASKEGKIYTKTKEGFKPLREYTQKNGYKTVSISYNGKQGKQYVHRLVLKAFVPNPKKYKCVNHLNGIKSDNRLENLEWCTHKQNTKHAIDMGIINYSWENNRSSLLSNKQRDEILFLYENNIPIKRIAKVYEVSQGTIYYTIRRWRKDEPSKTSKKSNSGRR